MDSIFEAQEAALYEAWLDSPAGAAYGRASKALIDRVLDCRPGWRVLDVGCGLGVHLEHLAERGMLCHGLEAGPVMAKMAARRLGHKADIDVGDGHHLPYEDNAFDAVIMVGTLELVDRRAQVLAEAARVASSRVCLITLDALSPYAWLARRPAAGHPYRRGRPLPLWSHLRLVREVLGPVPLTWAGASPWAGAVVRRLPGLGLVGVCAAVTPRYATRPLTVTTSTSSPSPRPAHSAGRVALRRIK